MGVRAATGETGQDRKALVADAGFKQLSILSVIAGALAAYGAFVVLLGLAAGVVDAVNADVDLASQWQELGIAGGLVVAGLLLLSYLLGGYAAGRMARRSGMVHGFGVFVLGLVIAAAAAALARALGATEVATANLSDLGIPTTAGEWGEIATVAGVASLAAMLIGALVGGALGERWHGKLLDRALDPEVGAEAEARRTAALRAAEAEERRAGATRRARIASPPRTRRVEGEIDGEEGGGNGHAPTGPVGHVASPQLLSPGREDEDATARPTALRGGRTG